MREKSSVNQGIDPENPEYKKSIFLVVVFTKEFSAKKNESKTRLAFHNKPCSYFIMVIILDLLRG